MVLGLRNISAAMWLICLPEASSHITRYSRSERDSCRGFSASGARSVASFSAKLALTYLPPFATLRMAPLNPPPAPPLLIPPPPGPPPPLLFASPPTGPSPSTGPSGRRPPQPQQQHARG